MQWPAETIKELLDRAEETGESIAELASVREAELFRYAIKNYKRKRKIGDNLTTNVVGATVFIRKKSEVRIGGGIRDETLERERVPLEPKGTET